MKRFRPLAFVCFLLCFVLAGCSANMKDAESVLPRLKEADRIVISIAAQANPAWASPAKDCTEPQDVQSVTDALLSLKIGDGRYNLRRRNRPGSGLQGRHAVV